MLKRLLSLLVSVLLLFSAASAEGMIASYVMPEGAQMRFLTEAGDFEIPRGLEGMYALMFNATLKGDVYLMRMRNGRVLASISCTRVDEPLTAEQLVELWPQIAQNLAREAVSVDDSPSCAYISDQYGFDMFAIRTELDVGTNNIIPVKAEAFAFCRGNEMIEAWFVYPNPNIYLYDQAAADELDSDLGDAVAFMDSLDFSAQLAMTVSGAEYADPAGRFSLQIPTTAVVLTQDSSDEERAACRERFTAANGPGAEVFFSEFEKDLDEQNGTLILTKDMKGAIQIYCSRNPDFQGVTTEMLCALSTVIRTNMEETYSAALLLGVEDGTWMLSGQKQAMMNYWLRADALDMQLDVLACVIGQDWLCEVDVYTADGEQTLREVLHMLLAQTLQYNVE